MLYIATVFLILGTPVFAACNFETWEEDIIDDLATSIGIGSNELTVFFNHFCDPEFDDSAIQADITLLEQTANSLQTTINQLSTAIANLELSLLSVESNNTAQQTEIDLTISDLDSINTDLLTMKIEINNTKNKFIEYYNKDSLDIILETYNDTIKDLTDETLTEHISWVENQTNLIEHLEQIYSVVNITQNFQNSIDAVKTEITQVSNQFDDKIRSVEQDIENQENIFLLQSDFDKFVDDQEDDTQPTNTLFGIQMEYVLGAGLVGVALLLLYLRTQKDSNLKGKIPFLNGQQPFVRQPGLGTQGTIEEMHINKKNKKTTAKKKPGAKWKLANKGLYS